MRKIRLSLKPEVEGWSFDLFDSPEAAYYLGGEPPSPDDDFVYNIKIEKGDFIEVEWMGAEYVYAKSEAAEALGIDEGDRYDRVRLAKCYEVTTNVANSGYVETYSGWVPKGTIPWSSRSHKQLKITRINRRNKPKLDFHSLFEDDVAHTEEPNKSKASSPVVLN